MADENEINEEEIEDVSGGTTTSISGVACPECGAEMKVLSKTYGGIRVIVCKCSNCGYKMTKKYGA